MALHFVTDDASGAGVGDVVVLTGPEAHHAAAVRRVRVDEPVTLGDGRGVWLDGVVTAAAPKQVDVRVTGRAEIPAPSPRIVLVQALAKGDRDELAVQAATELGVDVIVPWQAARSVSRWDAKAEKGLARWRTIVREAAKQAHRAWVPEVEGVARLADLVARARTANVFVLEPSAVERLTAVASDPLDDRDVVLVVGPEGGIAPEELDALRTAGARLVRLGDTVLRTSTAGAAAISVLSASTGRW
ncbi:MAG: 16S rRNA (uracil(1498)-N(3))-methyltransferase [Microbacterium sp. 71-36]|uniref:16S rRNA (uracil(1498)-N(3))-methyltransferase n=1 Tax=unclassified Microbacterium TaxID=2609290 RepID=UPI00086A6C86|nr:MULTISPECIES: 16S rRNA (uracil(1498)-N(3))-methyltransferase [unclassified Microbacterium]MBN9211975.1 16S rRNA (uracil(1498)-N(3))-methyltransferase [Microbacterium sp.]ODT38292.1 MAG: 16S rRNA (uracil(1498)-N(3))-methyltransferase [Microbacterium sp. SCN 71-17]OJV77044.1 MAG: 16S rRNA (uracil(1498)-N(3))-methyltransferase [Microbacterium sp. 71-36]